MFDWKKIPKIDAHVHMFTPEYRSFGAMSTPALVIDRQLQSVGRLLSVKECPAMPQKFRRA